jgi:hypothetical protein
VDVFALGVGGAFPLVGSDQLVSQLQMRGAPLLLADRLQNPANRQRLLPRAVHLHRHLVRGATDPAAADFDVWLDIFHGGVEDLNRILVRQLLLDDVERVVEHFLRDALLAVIHQAVDELGGQDRLVLAIRLELRCTSGNLAHTN